VSKEVLTEFEVGERLDKTLARLYPDYSRSAIEKLIGGGQVLVNQEMVKSKYILKIGDQISVDFTDLDRAPDSIDLPVIYEDENVVVINKPVGVLAHSKGAFNKEGTVATWLKNHVQRHSGLDPESSQKSHAEGIQTTPDLSTNTQDDETDDFWGSNRAGIVHRLDRATSGVMIVAKNAVTQKHLQKQFAQRNVKKTYLAVVSGELPENEGLIDVPIERNPKKPATFRAGINGKPAQTEFKVLQTTNHKLQTTSLVELKPHTGRTHQLRVHLAYLKHPIIGDEFYSGEPADRLMLHAASLELTLPGGVRKTWNTKTPKEFAKYQS
jgi:23S rRNA pseudouridine1911/1915/1917 synthase